MRYVFGIDPDTLASDYDFPTVIALAKAANRFLAKISGSVPPRPMKNPASKPELRGPDVAGFRELYGSQFRRTLR